MNSAWKKRSSQEPAVSTDRVWPIEGEVPIEPPLMAAFGGRQRARRCDPSRRPAQRQRRLPPIAKRVFFAIWGALCRGASAVCDLCGAWAPRRAACCGPAAARPWAQAGMLAAFRPAGRCGAVGATAMRARGAIASGRPALALAAPGHTAQHSTLPGASMAARGRTFVSYFVPHDGDVEEHPNVFRVDRPVAEVRLRDIRDVRQAALRRLWPARPPRPRSRGCCLGCLWCGRAPPVLGAAAPRALRARRRWLNLAGEARSGRPPPPPPC